MSFKGTGKQIHGSRAYKPPLAHFLNLKMATADILYLWIAYNILFLKVPSSILNLFVVLVIADNYLEPAKSSLP